MWVKAREREKNKEKHVDRAMFLTSSPLITRTSSTSPRLDRSNLAISVGESSFLGST
jgi:hypothetical protein